MNKLDRLNSNASQQLKTFTIDDGTAITLKFRFLPTQSLWILDVEIESTVINGISVVNSPNLLRGYRNIIPFGMMVVSLDGYDPHFIDDFENDRSEVFILSAAEVAAVEAGYNG